MTEITPFGVINTRVKDEATKDRNTRKASYKKLAGRLAIGLFIFLVVLVFRNGFGGHSPGLDSFTATTQPGQMATGDSPANGGSATQPAAPVKATATNGAAGDLDPIVVPPGATSPEVVNLRPELEVCHNKRPAYVDREVQLQTGEWIKGSQQNGRTVVAVRVINNGTDPFTWSVWRQAPGQNCIRPQN